MIFRSIFFSCIVVLFVYLPNSDAQPKTFAIREFEVADPTALQKEMFALLKEAYPGTLLDTNFKSLRELAKSEKYLTYLGEVYPAVRRSEASVSLTAEPNAVLFIEQVFPPKERYFPFFEASLNFESVEEITQTDLIGVHILANAFWKSEARSLEGEDFQALSVFYTPAIHTWLRERDMSMLGDDDSTSFEKGLLALAAVRRLVRANHKADALLVKKFFQKHGEVEGILWLAVQEPLLFGRILEGFTDIEIFREWTEEKIDRKTR